MNWRKTTDRIVNTSVRIFGEPVIYQRLPDPPFAVRGIYNQAYMENDPRGSGSDIDTTFTIIDIRAADLPYAPYEGDLVTVGIKVFRIWRCKPDGWARFRCYLEDV